MNIRKILRMLKRPAGVITWKFLTDRNNLFITQHRRALFYVPKEQPKLLYWGVIILRQLCWWSYFGWSAFYRIWKTRKDWVTYPNNISSKKVFCDLFYLTFFHTIPPANYFILRLYNYPKAKWMEFIYTHEVPRWQQSMNSKINKAGHRYINSKYYFFKKSIEKDIPVIPTLRYIKKGLKIKFEDIFLEKSIFLKPDNANRSNGCFVLSYNPLLGTYKLISEKNNTILHTPEEIIQQVNESLLHYDYLLQPLLQNHPIMEKLSSTKKLSTIRIITTHHKETILPISAIIEIPRMKDTSSYYFHSINLKTGIIQETNLQRFFSQRNSYKEMEVKVQLNNTIPSWQKILKMVKKAHSFCTAYKTIGWDVAVTKNIGVVIIEGNAGWGVIIHQLEVTFDSRVFLD